MKFRHRPYQPGETIAAIATPPGEGGVAIVRISGERAREVAAKVFTGPVKTFSSHTVHYGSLVDERGNTIDRVLLIPFLEGRSFTGEECIEIHCHGGALLAKRILEIVLAAGARLALPGEFSFKAFINGKLDLTQAEAIQELIGAKNKLFLEAAASQLEGTLSRKIASLQRRITKIAALFEAWVDFPEEGLEFASPEEIERDLDALIAEMERVHATYHDGKILREGITLAIIGSPNVGKSSLMNALLDHERAIVSEIAGTTRDLIEEHWRLNGLHVRLIDTAGIRMTDEVVEREGIRRARAALAKADLLLLVLDSSTELSVNDELLFTEVPLHKAIAVWNKIDLPHETPLPPLPCKRTTEVSARLGWGLDALKSTIDEVIWEKGPPDLGEVLLTNLRHKEALSEAIEALRRSKEGLCRGLSPEFVALDLRATLDALGQILGTDVTEDLLSAIFSTFCVGK